jgi:hypothetical protein
MNKKAMAVEEFLKILLWIGLLIIGMGGIYFLVNFLTKTAS